MRRPEITDAVWLAPIFVYLFLHFQPYVPMLKIQLAIAAPIGVGALLLAHRYPDKGLLIVFGFFPFSGVIPAHLHALGMPTALIRPMLYWKELILVAVVINGIQGWLKDGKHLDALDKVALGFIAIVALYALVPHLFNPDAPATGEIRTQGFRYGAAFVVLFLAARHTHWPEDFPRRAARVVLAASTIVAVIGIFEFFFGTTWNNYLVNTAQFPRYQIEVLHVPRLLIPNTQELRQVSTVRADIFRVGSTFVNPLSCGFYLVAGFALAVERNLRRGVRIASLATIAIGGALILTQTRAAIIAGIVMLLLAFRPAAGRHTDRRVRFAFLFAAGMLMAIPAAIGSGLVQRSAAVVGEKESSTTAHVDSFKYGVQTLIDHPLGLGLGTSAGAGQRYGGNTRVSENYYLQVGNEMGILGMLGFAATTALLVTKLRRAAKRVDDGVVAAYWGAFSGLAIGAFLLHTWIDLTVAWTIWGAAGVALGMAERRALAARQGVAAAPRPTVDALF